MSALTKVAVVAAALVAVAACSSLPDRVDSLEQARLAVRTVERDDLAAEVAANELDAARNALAEADEAYRNRKSLDLITHKAYLAQRYADIAKERIVEARAKQEIAQGEAVRNKVLLEARAREAEREARKTQGVSHRLGAAEQQGGEADRETHAAPSRNHEPERELAGLHAKETERGLVLTLGDVLFDTAQNVLKPGAATTLDRLAQFMRDNPMRQLVVEGHTDSRGPDDYNQQLSERRAAAVRDSLVGRGVGGERIRTVGFGEAYPVAGNDTAAGMQANRRVEVVISDEDGNFVG